MAAVRRDGGALKHLASPMVSGTVGSASLDGAMLSNVHSCCLEHNLEFSFTCALATRSGADAAAACKLRSKCTDNGAGGSSFVDRP